MKPIVFVLDLDNTIIGNIEPQAREYELIKLINASLTANNMRSIPYKKSVLERELRGHIIRPHFAKFIENMNKYENIELFIYTASIKEWARFVVPVIEKCVNYKFKRPLLTREDMIGGGEQKSIENVRPKIYRSLRKKYSLKSQEDLTNILMIDNRRDVLLEKNMLVKCPDYEYCYPIDYLRNIPKKIVKQYQGVIENYLFLNYSQNIYDFYAKYYKNLNQTNGFYKKYNKTRCNNGADNYWKTTYKVIKQYLKYINSNAPTVAYDHKKMIKILRSVGTNTS